MRRKTFDVLRYLVDHPGQLVTKEALLDAVWAGVTLSDSMPAICVTELRKALGDEARIPRFIETVHRRGYRFIAKVTTAAAGESTREAPFVPKGPKPIMVGRQDELVPLQGWYSRAVEGQRQVIFVTGEAGIGKTPSFRRSWIQSPKKAGWPSGAASVSSNTVRANPTCRCSKRLIACARRTAVNAGLNF